MFRRNRVINIGAKVMPIPGNMSIYVRPLWSDSRLQSYNSTTQGFYATKKVMEKRQKSSVTQIGYIKKHYLYSREPKTKQKCHQTRTFYYDIRPLRIVSAADNEDGYCKTLSMLAQMSCMTFKGIRKVISTVPLSPTCR